MGSVAGDSEDESPDQHLRRLQEAASQRAECRPERFQVKGSIPFLQTQRTHGG